MEKPRPPIEEVIERLGGLTKTAAALGIDNPSVISNWRTRGRIPVDWVLPVSGATGLAPDVLRPDLAAIFASKDAASLAEASA